MTVAQGHFQVPAPCMVFPGSASTHSSALYWHSTCSAGYTCPECSWILGEAWYSSTLRGLVQLKLSAQPPVRRTVRNGGAQRLPISLEAAGLSHSAPHNNLICAPVWLPRLFFSPSLIKSLPWWARDLLQRVFLASRSRSQAGPRHIRLPLTNRIARTR